MKLRAAGCSATQHLTVNQLAAPPLRRPTMIFKVEMEIDLGRCLWALAALIHLLR
jgi:hypothetical protein